MSSQPTVVETADLGYRYPNGLETLSGITFAVRPGEIVSIVGPSGCGKSTLLSLLSGLTQPTSGRILVDGSPMVNRRGRFSYMPQKDLLLPWRNARDNAALLLEIEGVSRSEARARSAAMLRDLDLDGFAGAMPPELSGGMRQRVALTRTFLPGRDVLLDEPFGALDAITRSELQEWLLRLHARTGVAIVLVTHDVEEALYLSDRIYVMSPRPGRIVCRHDVTFPRPRSSSLTATGGFTEMKGVILEQLRAAMRESKAA